jgi:AmpD protein
MPSTAGADRGRFALDASGWARGAERIESPNHDERPAGTAIELVVVHGISLPPGCYGGGFIEALFTNRLEHAVHPYFETLRGLKVSAHFLVCRDGRLQQFVSCLARAWHAGVSSWQGRAACNDYSVGIEFEGADDCAYARVQYATGSRLLAAILDAYPIRGIASHSAIAPGRKTDPGPHFEWEALAVPPRLVTP